VTVDQLVSRATHWLKVVINMAFLVMIAIVLVKAFGVALPVRSLAVQDLTWLAGAYWLTR
jgi:hypothetical protein